MILVTGGHGFVGKIFANALIEKYGAENVLVPSSMELDLLRCEMVEKYFKNHQVDVVYHLAARLGGVGKVMSKPLFFFENNLLINYNLVHVAIQNNVRRFITFGSSCSYANELPLPMKEKDFWKGRTENTYGTCKNVLYEHLESQHEMEWVYLIPPNLYGPGDHFGEDDAHFIPATVKKFLDARKKKNKYIEVWGDGSQIRDFVYIDDIVNILLDANDNHAYDCRLLNIATGVGATVKEIVVKIQEFMEMEDIDIHWDITKPTGTMKKILSNDEFLKIKPGFLFTDIHTGLNKTMKWVLSQK